MYLASIISVVKDMNPTEADTYHIRVISVIEGVFIPQISVNPFPTRLELLCLAA